MKIRRWTPEEDAYVVRAFSDGINDAGIGAAIGRTRKAVTGRRFILGAVSRLWTTENDAILRRGVADGRKNVRIAEEIGCSPATVCKRMIDLGIVRKPTVSQETVDRIGTLYEAGVQPTDISRRTGVTVGMVEYYLRRDGIVSPRSYLQMTVRPIDADLVDLSTRGLSTSEIARRLGVSSEVARGRLVTLARRDAVLEARAGL